ncbi:hypothetical protein FOCG_18010 [Fusarium oxysporum f. sp. radicis-lycopersici 26381]|uniref:Uncharacterized protein n=1 Tax=Fusarium oxysporum NRRL 32931 TaxID=660029 RepID=W9HBM1_FUSOX|nr:hypothetical protein FOYG_16885 [Fusarium oxysporum NRRL 32931]EWZ78474.1 hypothetical protein FOWG_17263 [Fusarium oxysporum f. sp. lycopersici MN25]EXL39386.1 hypothetical protein FOCG_18010 [Fusarium oxysporum f. sp. radicis-lycopersici 26381]
MAHLKTHQPSSGTAAKDNPSSPSKIRTKVIKLNTPPSVGIMTIPALTAILGALLYFIRATNFSIFGIDIGLLWGVPVECLVWSFAILMLAWIDVRGLIKG